MLLPVSPGLELVFSLELVVIPVSGVVVLGMWVALVVLVEVAVLVEPIEESANEPLVFAPGVEFVVTLLEVLGLGPLLSPSSSEQAPKSPALSASIASMPLAQSANRLQKNRNFRIIEDGVHFHKRKMATISQRHQKIAQGFACLSHTVYR